jgi:hypothetical protein
MKKVGVIILAIGVLITVITGFNFVTREKVATIGKIEITADKRHNLAWSPMVGVIVLAVGAGAYMLGTKK